MAFIERWHTPAQAPNFDLSPINTLPDSAESSPATPARRNPPRITLASAGAYAAGTIFTAASAGTNLMYAITKADTLHQQVIWGSVAVAASIALALAPSAVVQNLGQRKFGAASIAAAAAILFGAYSVTAALGSATGGRLVAELEAGDIAGKRKSATADIVKAEGDLTALGAARAVATIDAEINAVFSRTPGLSDCAPRPNWTPSKLHREACKAISLLQIEKTVADQRDKVQSRITAARKELAATGGRGTIANSDAEALKGFAAAIGGHVETDTLNKLLVILSVLLLELGGGLAFAVGQGLSGLANSGAKMHPVQFVQPARHPVAAAAIVQPPEVEAIAPSVQPEHQGIATQAATPADTAVPPAVQPLHTEAPGARRRVLDLIENAGGTVQGGQRAIAAQVGVSTTRLRQVLDGLVADGTVKVRAGTTATTISLA